MAGFLLLPDDEVALVAYLLETESLTRLAHDDLAYGPPAVGAPATPLPLPERSRHDVPARLTFWASQLGELRASADAPGFIDHERSPILSWHRTRWHATGALCPGRLKAQARPRKDQPKALLALHERVERWMKREGTRLNPFDHAPDGAGVERPDNEKPFAVWAHPHAGRWVREGGTVWPARA